MPKSYRSFKHPKRKLKRIKRKKINRLNLLINEKKKRNIENDTNALLEVLNS